MSIQDGHGEYGQPILQAKQTVKSNVFSVTVNSMVWENITGLDFSPDWVWIKAKSHGSYGGGLS